MLHFCTYFDSNYLPRAIALYQSLAQHCPAFHLWMLCFDDHAFAVLQRLKLPDVTPIALDDFERGDDALLAAKANRSRVEYIFTCTPSLPLYILRHHPQVERITYLDSDLFFFADPAPVFEEMADRSILIIPHRYLPQQKHLEAVFGTFNVQLLCFCRDSNGLAALTWWRERCLEWCGDTPDNGRFADQGYLSDWPDRFEGVAVLQHPGAGLAPWNLMHYTFSRRSAGLFVDESPLIFFHFHRFQQINRLLVVTGLRARQRSADTTALHLNGLFRPYQRQLRAAAQFLCASGFDARHAAVPERRIKRREPKPLLRMLRQHEAALTVGPFMFWL
jgi:hypothetical protein